MIDVFSEKTNGSGDGNDDESNKLANPIPKNECKVVPLSPTAEIPVVAVTETVLSRTYFLDTSKLDRTEEALYLSIEKKLKEQKELERKIKVLEEKDENKEIERNPPKRN
nr:446_t:CDS:2 [Entrophospora candida]